MSLKYFRIFSVISCIIYATTFTTFANINGIYTDTGILQTNNPVTHKVASGETVYSIARRYNTTVSEIYNLNPTATQGIRTGDVLSIPSVSVAVNQVPANPATTHTVKPKETLYSISKQYGLKIDDLINANPDLRSKPLAEGQMIKIPAGGTGNQPSMSPPVAAEISQAPISAPKTQFVTHVVAPQETIYGISRQYNVTTDALVDFNPGLKEGLKQGTTLIIPVLETVTNQVSTLRDVNRVSVGIVLPFINKSDGQSARFIEYYEGFLLALQNLKSKGFSANIYAFDMGSETGTEKLASLLETYEMKYLDLIIGGVSPQQIAVISDFAKRQGIKYAIPFPSKTDNTINNPYVFQINPSQNILYNNVARTFVRLFANTNVIYINEVGSEGDRVDFIAALNSELYKSGISAKKVVADGTLKDRLVAAMDPYKKNVIVPTSASAKMLQILMPALKLISTELLSTNLTLFGHTDWQTYSQYQREFGLYDTHIYTPFYLNERDFNTTQFLIQYRQWYDNKSLINTYPKYGVLGYDTGISFLSALWRYGKNFETNINSLSVSSLQTPFMFEKENPDSGYMNMGFYLVKYKEDGTVDKTEYGR